MIGKRATTSMLLLFLLLLCVLASAQRARATWHFIMSENFERPFYYWPWSTAGRSWVLSAGNDRWGIQATYFHGGVGEQSAWCYQDWENGHDPQYDTYPPNYYAHMCWGPMDLSAAEAALASFYIFNRSGGGDSLYWAAATNSNGSELKYGGQHSGILSGFEIRLMDFADLRNDEGDSVSMLGETSVYIYFAFRSNADANVNIGGFVDDLVISWDDGLADLAVVRLTFLGPDSVALTDPPAYGDTVIAELRWATFGIGLLPPFYLIGDFDDGTELDLLVDWAECERVYESYYPAQVMTSGDHTYSFELDPMNDVEETYEDNNLIDSTFHVDEPNFPPQFSWIRPGLEPDTADQSYLLQWSVEDVEDDAVIYLYYDTDSLGFDGYVIPGGAGISEDSGPDTLRWIVAQFPNGRHLWPYARVDDPVNSIQLYARAPIVVAHGAASPPTRRPVDLTFSLSQNYPNPFNEVTTICFSVSRPGLATLRITDLLGHERCVLVHEQLSPGDYRVALDAAGWSSGIYLCTLSCPQGCLTRKMILLK